MRSAARLLAATLLVLAGGLTLPGGAAQAAACSGTSGVTVVIDYGSSSATLCSPGDPSSAGGALRAVAGVDYVPMYGQGVVCKINGIPSSQTCQRMPPSSAYWAFFHASRGGSWTYSSVGVADYNPAPGTVVGFAFGSGGAPSTAPPAASAPAPKPSPKPSPKPAPKPSPKPSASSSSTPATPRAGSGSTPKPAGTSPRATSGSSGTTAAKPPVTTTTPGTTTAPGTTTTPSPGTGAGTPSTSPGAGAGDGTTRAASSTAGQGSPATLFAGVGLVALLGAAAAYLTLRRRAQQ